VTVASAAPFYQLYNNSCPPAPPTTPPLADYLPTVQHIPHSVFSQLLSNWNTCFTSLLLLTNSLTYAAHMSPTFALGCAVLYKRLCRVLSYQHQRMYQRPGLSGDELEGRNPALYVSGPKGGPHTVGEPQNPREQGNEAQAVHGNAKLVQIPAVDDSCSIMLRALCQPLAREFMCNLTTAGDALLQSGDELERSSPALNVSSPQGGSNTVGEPKDPREEGDEAQDVHGNAKLAELPAVDDSCSVTLRALCQTLSLEVRSERHRCKRCAVPHSKEMAASRKEQLEGHVHQLLSPFLWQMGIASVCPENISRCSVL
jgi:hypothetical protein